MDDRPTAPPPLAAASISTCAPSPSGAPALADGDVHVWRADLARADPALGELLTADEHERAARIAGAQPRETWRAARGMLRALLARYLDAEPHALRIVLGEHGKPQLADDELHFNLSHSGALALYAVTRAGPVGIDVQLARPRSRSSRQARDVLALARRAFGEETAGLLAALEPARREHEFLRLWARYEAELKRRATGISGRSPLAARSEPAPWLVELDVGADGAAALACSTPPHELRYWDWPSAAPLRRS
jgi:4'-phosphopantetheinyl transferase